MVCITVVVSSLICLIKGGDSLDGATGVAIRGLPTQALELPAP